jgi:hypothetical protein
MCRLNPQSACLWVASAFHYAQCEQFVQRRHLLARQTYRRSAYVLGQVFAPAGARDGQHMGAFMQCPGQG